MRGIKQQATKSKPQKGRQRENIRVIQVSKKRRINQEHRRTVTARNQNTVKTGEQEKGGRNRQKEVES